MLNALDRYLKGNGVRNFKTINASAENLPLPDDALDCMFSFNSVHHFSLRRFLEESARILKKGGYLFIYTRLQQQNERNIWGQYFHNFSRKESRLYGLSTFVEALIATPGLRAKSVEHFKYRRISDLDRLVEQARANHYSTFGLYQPEELEEAILGFRRNIECYFEDIHRVQWYDENVLFVIRKED
jgi:ubiquinone/menaquinone biosynthesis C-methylase UbiE